MLERFKVPPEDQIRVPHESLRRTVTDIFLRMGVPPEDAETGADVLVTTDLRGVETHGVSNMLRVYVQLYTQGRLNPRPNVRVARGAPGMAVIDGDGGLGVILGPRAMRMAMDKARQTGVGVVTMFNSGHLGAVGHHAMIAAQHDMVGVCITAGGALVAPTFGAQPRLGTNPISIAAPAKEEPPLLFDAATSTIAGNKVRLAARVGSKLLPGWIADKDGRPIMEEVDVPPRGEYQLLPLGGTREQGSHKGYGFALMAEVLCTMLSGVLPTMLEPNNMARHYFAAYNIAAFTDLDRFKENMDRMLRALRETPPAPGHQRVLYPGLPEYEEERERRQLGIPLHREVVEWFDQICEELSIAPLERATA